MGRIIVRGTRDKRPKPTTSNDGPWIRDQETFAKIMEALSEPVNLMFYLGNRSGMRPGEVAGLRMEDFNWLKEGIITAVDWAGNEDQNSVTRTLASYCAGAPAPDASAAPELDGGTSDTRSTADAVAADAALPADASGAADAGEATMPPGTKHDGGCAIADRSGDTAVGNLAAVVALVVLRRRRRAK